MKMSLPVSDGPIAENKDTSESLSVTVSIGVTAVKGDEQSLEDAFKRADEALYQSKQEGRNRVSIR